MYSFLANLLATIFMLLNLNAVMSIIANVPAAIASTVRLLRACFSMLYQSPLSQIVACRAVRRLSNYTSTGVEVYGYVSSIATTWPPH